MYLFLLELMSEFSELRVGLQGIKSVRLPPIKRTLIGRTPRGLYSPKAVFLPSRCLLGSPFSEPLLRRLLRTLPPSKTHSKTPSKNPSRKNLLESISRTLVRTLLRRRVVARPPRCAPYFKNRPLTLLGWTSFPLPSK